MSTEGAPPAGGRKVAMRAIASPERGGAAGTVRVKVAVRFPGLPHVSGLEFDASWPVEAMRRWLSLARLVLNADGPVCASPPPTEPAPAPADLPSRRPPPPALHRQPPQPPGQSSGDELRQRRQRAGLSQAQVAAASGLSRSTVSLLEGGRPGVPARGASRTRLTRTLARLASTSGQATPQESDR
jgi:hypothetical protein